MDNWGERCNRCSTTRKSYDEDIAIRSTPSRSNVSWRLLVEIEIFNQQSLSFKPYR